MKTSHMMSTFVNVSEDFLHDVYFVNVSEDFLHDVYFVNVFEDFSHDVYVLSTFPYMGPVRKASE